MTNELFYTEQFKLEILKTVMTSTPIVMTALAGLVGALVLAWNTIHVRREVAVNTAITKDTNSMINGGVERDLVIGLTSAKALFILSKTDEDKKLMDDAAGRLDDHRRKMAGPTGVPAAVEVPIANKP